MERRGLSSHKLGHYDMFDFGGNGDGTLFYPGRPDVVGGTDDIPIESIRLKLIRDGYEDYEYMKFLSDQGKRAQVMSIVWGLFPDMFHSSVTDAALQAARLQLVALISPAGVGVPPPG